MTGLVGSGNNGQDALYWHRRNLELTKLANQLYRAVEETRVHQATLETLGETEKIGSEKWEAAMDAARKSLRSARTLRSRFRAQLFNMKDTVRIRPHLAKSAPSKLLEDIDKGIQYLSYLEAHGF